MITLLFANLLVRKFDPSDIWYVAAVELLVDLIAMSFLFWFVFLK